MKKEVLRMEHIYVRKQKRYVLKDFKLNIYEGEFIALFGFSGSGIYELGEVLSARLPVERGRILICEKEINLKKTFFSEKEGIFVVHREHGLMPDLTVAENLFFGGNIRPFSLVVSAKKQSLLARKILDKFDVDIDVSQKARDLMYHEEVILRLIKAYAKGAKVIVFSEIAELTYIRGGAKILEILEKLKSEGISILWINHRIESVRHLLDGVVVARDGKNVKTFYHENYSMELLLRAAENNEIRKKIERPKGTEDGIIMTLENISSEYLKDVSIQIQRNQITGIWANEPMVLGHLRSIICGEKIDYDGTMYIDDRLFYPNSYEKAVKQGIQYIDSIWHERHTNAQMSITDNLMMQNYWLQKPIFAVLNSSWRQYTYNQYLQRHLDWPKGNWEDLTSEQQRILLYERCLKQPGKIYLIAEAFAEFNYKTTEEVVNIFRELLDKGKTLILLSMNIQDLYIACDKIYLIQDRKLVREAAADEYEKLNIWDYIS